DPARLADPAHGGPGGLRPREEHLVRGRPAAVQQSRRGQQGAPGAYRHRHLELAGARPQPVDEAGAVDLRPRADAARHEQEIEPRAVLEPVIGVDTGALRAAHQAGPVGHGAQRHGALHVAEHLERPEEIEQLEVLVEQCAERPGGLVGHGFSSSPSQATNGLGRRQGQAPHRSGLRSGSPRAGSRASETIDSRINLHQKRRGAGNSRCGGTVVRIYLVTPHNPQSFWTYDHVLPALGKRCVFPNLSMPTLAGLTPREHEVILCDENVEEVDLDLEADIVGITGYIVHRERMLELADEFRRRGRFVVIGGPYASLCPEELRGRCNVLFVDEAEETWPEFLRDVAAGAWRAGYPPEEKPDLTPAAMPRFDLLHVDRYHALTIQFARGCPFNCEFCDIIVVYGRRPRAKSVPQVMAEIEECHRLGAKQVFLVDDNFIGNKKLAKELLRAIAQWSAARGHPIHFNTEVSLNV